jgi:hypothetical protein
MALVSGLRLDTVGNRQFSGARQVPGADVWLARETSRGLDPDGWMVRRPHGRHHREENRDASAATSRRGVPGGAPRKKVVKSGVGGSIAS